MTGFGGIQVYLDLAQAADLTKSIDKHIKQAQRDLFFLMVNQG
jgi:hypothetical protein